MSTVSLHREKVYEECSIEIQDCLTDEQCASDKFTMFTMFMWFDFTTCPLGPSWPILAPFVSVNFMTWTEIASLKSKVLLSGVQMQSVFQIEHGSMALRF